MRKLLNFGHENLLPVNYNEFVINCTSTDVCVNGTEPKCCDIRLCIRSGCPMFPRAHCRINPCGAKCSTDFFVNHTKVDCFKGNC